MGDADRHKSGKVIVDLSKITREERDRLIARMVIKADGLKDDYQQEYDEYYET